MINFKLLITFFLTKTIISSINKTHYHFHFEKTSPVHNLTVGQKWRGCGVVEKDGGKCTSRHQCNGARKCSQWGWCAGASYCCEVTTNSTCCYVDEPLRNHKCQHSGQCEGFRYCSSGVCKGESGCSAFVDPEAPKGLDCDAEHRFSIENKQVWQENLMKCFGDYNCNGHRTCERYSYRAGSYCKGDSGCIRIPPSPLRAVGTVPKNCTPGWTKMPGSATNVSAYLKDLSYVVNNTDGIYQKTPNSWKKLSGAAKDIGVGADRSVWVIGNNVEGGGYGIYKKNGDGWTKVPGSAVRIAVDPNGKAWVVNKFDHIFRYNGSKWQRMSGAAKDIGISADGTVWVIGTNKMHGGYGIYVMYNNNGERWTKMKGSGVRISVDPNGKAWVVNKFDHIYRYNARASGGWDRIVGTAKDIGVGIDGSVWKIGTDVKGHGYGIYRYNC